MGIIGMLREKLVLSENARLFDTKEYLFKTFLAVLAAGVIGSRSAYVSKDMISLLFGMMLTLEPVNMSGIRSGLSQIQATLIGAVITGVVVTLFGYGVVQTAVGITLTLYVCLLINWRELMVVAVFTAIYITQYVQLDVMGNPSSIETTKLRLAALGTGVLIAFAVNFLFSLIGYRRLVEKRIYYISKELHEKTEAVRDALSERDLEKVIGIMRGLQGLFNTIDWITGTLADVKKDQQRFKVVYRHFDVETYLKYSQSLRGITHVIYDLCHRVELDGDAYMEDGFLQAFDERLEYFSRVRDAFDNHETLPETVWTDCDLPWINHYSKSLQRLKNS